MAACNGGGTVYGNGNFAATAGFSNNIFIALSCSDSQMMIIIFAWCVSHSVGLCVVLFSLLSVASSMSCFRIFFSRFFFFRF